MLTFLSYRLYPFFHVSADSRSQEYGKIIYQLGVLILELLTGQSSDQGEDADLSQWIQDSCFGSSIYKMLDPDLGNDYNSVELRKLLAVARLCIKTKDQPTFTIPQISRYLQNKVEVPFR